jgi:UDP-glucose 4-epimerase
LLRGEPMTIFGDGEQQRAFTHVGDVAPLIAESVEAAGARNQVFNVGADVPFTVNRLAEVVAGAMGKPLEVRHLQARNEVKIAFSDHSKAERVFGKRPKVPLEEGIARMAQWVKAHGARESCVFKNIEILKNLPPSWQNATLGAAVG